MFVGVGASCGNTGRRGTFLEVVLVRERGEDCVGKLASVFGHGFSYFI